MIDATPGSGCEIRKSPCSGLERGTHMSFDIGSAEFVPHHRAAKVSYDKACGRCQTRVGDGQDEEEGDPRQQGAQWKRGDGAVPWSGRKQQLAEREVDFQWSERENGRRNPEVAIKMSGQLALGAFGRSGVDGVSDLPRRKLKTVVEKKKTALSRAERT